MVNYFVVQDNSSSLQQFLVQLYVKKFDTESEKCVLPTPEPSDITKASLVNFEEIDQELKKLKSSLEGKHYI